MGILGIVIGPALLIIAPAPMVMAFWLLAAGLLFLGIWPSGLPPAWSEGRAVPWPRIEPSRPEKQGEAGGSRNGEVDPVGPGVRRPDDEEKRTTAHQARRKKRKRR
jgi:hypothetical protein